MFLTQPSYEKSIELNDLIFCYLCRNIKREFHEFSKYLKVILF